MTKFEEWRLSKSSVKEEIYKKALYRIYNGIEDMQRPLTNACIDKIRDIAGEALTGNKDDLSYEGVVYGSKRDLPDERL